MGYGRANTGETGRDAPPLPADLVGQYDEIAGWQPSLSDLPRPDGHTTFAALALGVSLTNVIGGAHLLGTSAESPEPWATDAATTSLVVGSGNTNHAPALARPRLTTVRIHEGQTFWGIENDDHLPHGLLIEANPSLVPSDIPSGSLIKSVPTGAVHEIAAQHQESPDAAAFEILISAEGGRTWQNGPKAPLPGKGDGVLLHEAGSGYFSGIIESLHTDSSGRHFAKVNIVEFDQTVMVRTSDTQRLIEFGSRTPAPNHLNGHAHQASEAAAASSASASPEVSPGSSASDNHGRTLTQNVRAPSAVPSIASASPQDAFAPSVSPRPQTSVSPSASVAPNPVAINTTGTQRESDPAAGYSPAVTPDLSQMLNHPAKLASDNTELPGAVASHAMLDAYFDAPGASPSPGPSTSEPASPAASATSSASSTETTTTGGDTSPAASAPAVTPDLGWLGNGNSGKQGTQPGGAVIPGVPSSESPSPHASPANSAASSVPASHEASVPTEQSVGHSIANRAKRFALNSSAYHQAWEKEASVQGYADQSWAVNLGGFSCDELTSSSAEEFDPSFPMFDTGVQYNYMMNSPKWQPVHITELSQLRVGDVFNWGGGDTSGGAAGHTGIFIGYDSTIGGPAMVAASLGRPGHGPIIEAAYLYDTYAGRPLQVFRPVVRTQAQTGGQSQTPHAVSTPKFSPLPSTSNNGEGGLANIPGAVAPNLGSFAVFNAHPNTGSGSNSGSNPSSQSQGSQIPGTSAVSPNLSWLGATTTPANSQNGSAPGQHPARVKPTASPSQSTNERKTGHETLNQPDPKQLAAFMAAELIQESEGNWSDPPNPWHCSGGYQISDSMWNGHDGYVHASDAPPAVQYQFAKAMYTQYWHTFGGDWLKVAMAWYAGPKYQQYDNIYAPQGNGPSIYDYGKQTIDGSSRNPGMQAYMNGTSSVPSVPGVAHSVYAGGL